MSADVDELRARIEQIKAKRPKTATPRPQPQPRTPDPGRRPPSRSWSGGLGASSGARLISTHNHGGHMVYDGPNSRCDGCGQEWVYLSDGERPATLYARPYRGEWRALPFGTRSRAEHPVEDW